MADRAVDIDLRVAPVLPVSIPFGRAVEQRLVLWAHHTIVVLVINILRPLMPPFHGPRPLIGCGRHTPVLKCFCRYVVFCRRNRQQWSPLQETAVLLCRILHQTPRCHGHCRRSVPFPIQTHACTGRVGFIGKLPLMFPFSNSPLSGPVTLFVTI